MLLRIALAGACLTLGACAFTLDYPSVAEAALVVDGQKVNVESLHCAADGTVLAVGSTDSLAKLEGVALYSGDRGATWVRASLEPSAPGVPLSLFMLRNGADSTSLHLSGYRLGQTVLSVAARAAYEPGPWWTTSDGGQSWHQGAAQLPLPATSVVDAKMPEVVVADEAGTLVTIVEERGNQLVLLRSTDRGKSWGRQTLPGLRHYGSMVSDGRGQLVLTGRSVRDEGVIRWSADAGATWADSRLKPQTDFPFRLPSALRLYRGPGGAWIAFNNDHLGKGRSATWLYTSADGGRTWAFARGFNRLGRIVGIAGNANGRVLAITDWGNVLQSDDGGATWRQGRNPTDTKTQMGASNIIFSDDGIVLATLDRATFVRSTDGGETWRPVDSQLPDRQYVLGANCTDGHGLIVIAGSGGMLTRSTDWGATWQRGQMQGTSAFAKRTRLNLEIGLR